jgi:sensor histidine kinase YesM
MGIQINDLQKGWYRILSHILFWLLYISFYVFQSAIFYKSISLWPAIGSITLTTSVDILATYFTVYVLLPEFLLKKRYLAFSILFLISAAIFVISQQALGYYVRYPLFYPHLTDQLKGFWNFNPFYQFVSLYSVVGLFTAVKMIKFWFFNQQMKAELENRNKTSELALLRSQLNPHFLFNTLNNIDTLIMKDPQKASDSIIKLSEILRSVVYENEDLVPLANEVEYLNNYIDLQRLRLKDPDFVQFNVTGNIQQGKIAPMILIPFVENAFKHGIKNVTAPGIMIHLYCEGFNVVLEVKNFINDTVIQNKDARKGVGMANTKRRLELLYPDNYELDIEKGSDFYRVKLLLKLKNYED